MCRGFFFFPFLRKGGRERKKNVTDNPFVFIVRLISDLPNAINPSRQQKRMKNTTDGKTKTDKN